VPNGVRVIATSEKITMRYHVPACLVPTYYIPAIEGSAQCVWGCG